MKEFETDKFKMTIHDDLIKEVRVKQNKTLEVKDIWESLDLSVKYKPDTKLYVLLEGEENSAVSADARTAVASEEYYKYTAALALCSNKMLESIKGNLFLKINRPKVPTRFFDNRDKAILWLKEQFLKSQK